METINASRKQALSNIIAAIRTLKKLEQSGESASTEDQAQLARFTGFGAVARTAFPNLTTGEFTTGWETLGQELRSLLTDEEYASAKATTFSAFYTSAVVMDAMHQGLARMGIGDDSRGLEPGCGIGNFIGHAPAGMKFIGIEQDSLSGRIAALLHPDHDIRIEGFQDSELPEACVDFAIGNVPFAEITLRHRGERHALHDFFFLKSLDAVRPGGALALVTSRYTMDKVNPRVRERLAEQADFIAAIRLPEEAFGEQGTSVVTDIIFLRKKLHELDTDRTQDHDGIPATKWPATRWLATSTVTLDGGEAALNDYFRDNPHMVLGTMSVGHGRYNHQTLRVRSDGELAAALHAAIDGLPAAICPPRTKPLASTSLTYRDPALPAHLKEGSFYTAPDRTILQVMDGSGAPVLLRDTPLRSDGTPVGQKLGALIDLRDGARAVLQTQKDNRDDDVKETARQRLRQSYAAFTARFGPINKTTLSERQDGTVTRRMPNLLRFRADPDVYLVMALEQYDERSGKATPAAIMHRDVIASPAPTRSVDSARDGLLASLNRLGVVDIPTIANLYGRSQAEVIRELGQLIFFDQAEDGYVTADAYLSGNVRQKLQIAEASRAPRTQSNAEALKQVQPEDLLAEEIDVTLGTPWIPAEDIRQFLAETLDVSPTTINVDVIAKEALWKVRPGSLSHRKTPAAISEFGTEDADAYLLTEQALNMHAPTIRRAIPGGPGESTTYVVDQEATLAAREKQAALKARFADWAFAEHERSARLTRFYNDHFNNLKLRAFDGAHLTFPGMSRAITMRPHQKDAIWRTMTSGNTLLAHVVGAGKTFTMVAAGMEMKRTGLASKPLYVVPNHMLEQFSREFLTLYPDASILVATRRDLAKDRRLLFKARMTTGNWDGIVMTHASFEKIAVSPEFQASFMRQQMQEYEALLETTQDRSLSRNLIKRIEKLKAARKIKLEEMTGSKDGGLYFEELGIDQIFIDEAHMFKNLETPTKMERVAGIQTTGSNRAFDLLMKARYLQSKTPGRGLTFATGTPVSNSLGEMYTMMRYLMPSKLEERGIAHFDSWAANFGEVVNSLEISPDGQSLRVNARFAKFKNLPELLSLFRLTADVQTSAMLNLPTPALAGGKAAVMASPMTEEQSDMQDALVKRYARVKSGAVKPHQDNALAIITDGRKLALDTRLVDPNADGHPDAKVNKLVDQVFDIWQQTREARSTQMVFCDLGVKPTEWRFSVYDDIIHKLVQRGIPSEEIAAIGDANTDQKKEALFATVRSGRVRVLIGSTIKMGTGTNVQDKLVALHHLDPPWRPADIEQREGRILRQGNSNAEVAIYRYVTEGSFDAYMWQTLETKARFIAQAMAGDAGTRRADDIGGAELSFAEVKAIASGNPAMLVLAEMDLELRQLTLLRKAHLRDQAKIAAEVQMLPQNIAWREAKITALEADIARRKDTKGDGFRIEVNGHTIQPEKGEKHTARKRAQEALALAIKEAASRESPLPWERTLGSLGGLDIVLHAEQDVFIIHYSLQLQGQETYTVLSIADPKNCSNLIQPIEHTLRSLDKELALLRRSHAAMTADLERYQKRANQLFPSEATYQQLTPLRDRLKQLLRTNDSEAATEGISTQEAISDIVDQYRGLIVRDKATKPEEPKSLPQAKDVEVTQPPEPLQPIEAANAIAAQEATGDVELARESRETAQSVENQTAESKPLASRATHSGTASNPIPPGGQLGLWVAPTTAHKKPTTTIVRAISAAPVQLGLFDTARPILEVTTERAAAWDIRHPAGGETPPENTRSEADRWRQSLSPEEEQDMRDMLENGAHAGALEPTERNVIGRFTRLLGDRPKLDDIIHDAIEHYEPYSSMVTRIERETGKRSNSPEEERGERSLYNAAVFRMCSSSTSAKNELPGPK